MGLGRRCGRLRHHPYPEGGGRRPRQILRGAPTATSCTGVGRIVPARTNSPMVEPMSRIRDAGAVHPVPRCCGASTTVAAITSLALPFTPSTTPSSPSRGPVCLSATFLPPNVRSWWIYATYPEVAGSIGDLPDGRKQWQKCPGVPVSPSSDIHRAFRVAGRAGPGERGARSSVQQLAGERMSPPLLDSRCLGGAVPRYGDYRAGPARSGISKWTVWNPLPPSRASWTTLPWLSQNSRAPGVLASVCR